MSDYSENEDDPDVFESSGDDWAMEDEKKKGANRRTSKRLSKKARVTHSRDSTDEESSETEAGPKSKKKSKNGMNKKQKLSNSTSKSVSSETKTKTAPQPAMRTLYSESFETGSFVILKKDAQVGDPNKRPHIWRVDGKALLQKYEAFEQDGNIRHKNTSIYTGWSALDKDLYAPVQVKVLQHSNQNVIVELFWEKLKEINMDSD